MKIETGPEGEPICVADKDEPVLKMKKQNLWGKRMSNFAPDVHPRLLEVAVTGQDPGDEPKLAAETRELEKRGYALQKAAAADRRAELEADLTIGKSLADQLHDHAFKAQLQIDLAHNVLVTAIQREQDSYVKFVDVSGYTPREAAKRVSVLKEQHPEWEIEPVDVTEILGEMTVKDKEGIVVRRPDRTEPPESKPVFEFDEKKWQQLAFMKPVHKSEDL